MEIIEEIRRENKILKIYQYDDNDIDVRDWDNLGIIAYKHRDYVLGEEEIKDPIEWLEEKLFINNKGIYTDERLEELEKKFFENYVVLPLYLYDHSGLRISTEPFGCRWDSGKVGYIYTTKEKRKEYGVNRFKALDILRSEIKLLDEVFMGKIYGYNIYEIKKVKITKDYGKGKVETYEEEEQEIIDGCSGYIGSDGLEEIREENGSFFSATRKAEPKGKKNDK